MGNSGASRKIAKNTLTLYIRQIAILVINLYTVRQVLAILGESDYGIYTLVAGIVTMFNVFSGSMAQACQRFFSYDLGRKDYRNLNKTLSAALFVYAFIALIIILLTETIGLWYISNKLTIPAGREYAAVFIYQTSVASLLFTVISAPFLALVISFEDMDIYAIASVLEVALKLVLIILIRFSKQDKLVIYGCVIMTVTILNAVFYLLICKTKYRRIKLEIVRDWQLYKQITGFAGWNLIGAFIYPLKVQALNVVLNQYFGTLVITARGIATSVNSAVTSFSINFGNALRPQIVKKYAIRNEYASIQLVYTGSKITYILMFAIVFPFIMEMNFVLEKWLGKVPEYAALFAQLTLIDALIESVTNPLMALVDATGNIKKYQIIVGGLQLLNLPITWLAIRITPEPAVAYYVAILIAIWIFIARTSILSELTRFSVKGFYAKAVFRVLAASAIPVLTVLWLKRWVAYKIVYIFLMYTIFEIITAVSFWTVALDNNERKTMMKMIGKGFGGMK